MFPGAVVTDARLGIAVNGIQTRLSSALSAVAASITVADASGMEAGLILTIDDSETVQVSGAPVGNVVPVTRGFGGTTAAVHASGATVAAYIDAWHHNALVAEVEAIESSLLGTVGGFLSTAYDFDPQTPGVALIAGGVDQTIPLAPMPLGLAVGSKLYISGGTGTAEAVAITAVTGTGGDTTGSIKVTPANAHTGAWTIRSATAWHEGPTAPKVSCAAGTRATVTPTRSS
jgi:hypothetical protein